MAPVSRRGTGATVVRAGCYTEGVDIDKTALVTGGTGGLGTAVTTRLLADGWRVVVPWIAEAELERLEPHPNLELIKADLFEVDSVAEVAALAGGREDAPLRAVANRLIGILHGCLKHRTLYNEHTAWNHRANLAA